MKKLIFIIAILFGATFLLSCSDDSENGTNNPDNDSEISYNIDISSGPDSGTFTAGGVANVGTTLLMSAGYAERNGGKGVTITVNNNATGFQVNGIINLDENDNPFDLSDAEESWDIGDGASMITINTGNNTYISKSGTLEVSNLSTQDFSGDDMGAASMTLDVNGIFDVAETFDQTESISITGEMVFNTATEF